MSILYLLATVVLSYLAPTKFVPSINLLVDLSIYHSFIRPLQLSLMFLGPLLFTNLNHC